MDNQVQELTLGEFLEVLQERGRDDDAEKYWWKFLSLAISKGVTPDKIFSMTLDECVRSVNMPRGPRGWSTMWGEKIIYPDR